MVERASGDTLGPSDDSDFVTMRTGQIAPGDDPNTAMDSTSLPINTDDPEVFIISGVNVAYAVGNGAGIEIASTLAVGTPEMATAAVDVDSVETVAREPGGFNDEIVYFGEFMQVVDNGLTSKVEAGPMGRAPANAGLAYPLGDIAFAVTAQPSGNTHADPLVTVVGYTLSITDRELTSLLRQWL